MLQIMHLWTVYVCFKALQKKHRELNISRMWSCFLKNQVFDQFCIRMKYPPVNIHLSAVTCFFVLYRLVSLFYIDVLNPLELEVFPPGSWSGSHTSSCDFRAFINNAATKLNDYYKEKTLGVSSATAEWVSPAHLIQRVRQALLEEDHLSHF